MAEDFDLRQHSRMYHDFLRLVGFGIIGVFAVLVLLVLVAL